MNKLNVVCLSLLLAITAACTEPDREGLSSDANFASLDANQDGVIDKREANTNVELLNNWAAIDLDQDGAINSQEYIIHAGESTAAGRETDKDLDTRRYR
ncbi:hypothetical protein HCH_03354 [Hahella chejuensis KCTC 2396]|uniref:EF-hand domain-containing protein n=1 Tax=Hahella chejuensis (strain KCTC 2396) TaxID=349521 RepID=Q2SGW6_HAHCH|nr:hypothetical protein [Hahella chejuensis]ABC30108.1 hypothetical protein HCH_03354 [Hahella chejuensis KCTC 2396]